MIAFGVALGVVLVLGIVLANALWMVSGTPLVMIPGLYVATTYHNVNDVLVFNYTASPGTVFPPMSLLGGGTRVMQVRGMCVLPDGSLLLAQGLQANSVIYRFPNQCSGAQYAPWIRANLAHPYGINHNGRGTLYVANQNSNQITHYNYTTGQPIGSGVFATMDVPRGLDVNLVTGNVYGAARAEGFIVEFSGLNGTRVHLFPCGNAIGILYWNGYLLGGCDKTASIEIWDATTRVHLNSLTNRNLIHPAGLTIGPGPTLLVMAQQTLVVLAWDLSTSGGNATYKGLWLNPTPGIPEQMITLSCP